LTASLTWRWWLQCNKEVGYATLVLHIIFIVGSSHWGLRSLSAFGLRIGASRRHRASWVNAAGEPAARWSSFSGLAGQEWCSMCSFRGHATLPTPPPRVYLIMKGKSCLSYMMQKLFTPPLLQQQCRARGSSSFSHHVLDTAPPLPFQPTWTEISTLTPLPTYQFLCSLVYAVSTPCQCVQLLRQLIALALPLESVWTTHLMYLYIVKVKTFEQVHQQKKRCISFSVLTVIKWCTCHKPCRIRRPNWDKSLQSFPPCYSQSPLLTDFLSTGDQHYIP
jgi:hypothetical protein